MQKQQEYNEQCFEQQSVSNIDDDSYDIDQDSFDITNEMQSLIYDLMNQVIDNETIIVCLKCNHQRQCNCHKQNKKQTTHIKKIKLVNRSQVVEDEINDNTYIDMYLDQKTRQLHCLTDNYKQIIIQASNINVNITEQNIERTQQPIYKYEQKMKQQQLNKYYPSSVIVNSTYNNAIGNQLLNKIIHDNNIQFTTQDPILVYYDVETYNNELYNDIPQYDNYNSHIGCICLQIVHVKSNMIQKIAIINDKHYDYSNIDKDITVYAYNDESLCCQKFFNIISQLPYCFIIGFNSSSNIYNDDKPGYDLPFIINRSKLVLTHQSKQLNIPWLGCQGIKITRIDQLQNVQIIDIMECLMKEASQDDRNLLKSYKLDDWLSLYKIENKQDHDYYDLQRRLAQKNSSISDIINYCMQDCNVLYLLDQHKGIIAQKLIIQSILKLPISSILHNSQVTNTTVYLQQQYINNGYICIYSQGDNQLTKKYKGAYCETIAQANRIYSNVIDLDYESLYPSCILSRNISLESYQQEYSDDCYVIDISDDDCIEQQECYYNKKQAIIPTFISQMKEQRMYHKSLKSLSIYHDHMQLQLKLLMNSMYGLLGYQHGLLYFPQLAISITAFARQSTILARDIIIQRQHQFLSSDTDSIFFVLNDNIMSYNDIVNETVIINDQIQEQLQSPYLKLSFEEYIQKIMFIDGKKTYISQEVTGQQLINWNKTNDTINEYHYKYRGVQWGKMTDYQRSLFKQHIDEYFNGNNNIIPLEFYKSKYNEVFTQIQQNISNNDKQALIEYSQKIKTTGKAQIVQCLQQYHIGNQQYIQCMILKGNGNKCYRTIPLSNITDNQMKYIDIDHHCNQTLSMLNKFLINKGDKKLSKYKQQLNDIQQDLMDGMIILRNEKLQSSGKVKYSTVAMNIDQIQVYINRNPNISLHEIINNNIIRLSFDVDQCENIQQFNVVAIDVIQQMTNVKCQLINIKSTGNKEAYHCYSNISLTLEFAKQIAQRINKQLQYEACDTAIYALNKSLRIPNVIKYTNNELINRQYKVDSQLFTQCLLTNTQHCAYIYQPLTLQQSLPIDDELKLQLPESYTDQHRAYLSTYLNNNDIIYSHIDQSQNRLDVRVIGQFLCPIHNKTHDNDNLFAICSKTQLRLYCYRSEQQNRKDESIVLKFKQQQQAVQSISKIQIALKQCQQPLQYLQNAIIQNNQYLQMNTTINSKMTFIKSGLGTGKTYYLQQLLQQNDYNRVLILSHRKTFTNNVKCKYNCQSYEDIVGNIYLEKQQKVICQVESLNRIFGTPQLLILDEIESLVQQLISSIALKNNVLDRFIQLIKQSDHIIICDGLLQQATIDMLINITQCSNYDIHENIYQPYKQQIVIKEYNSIKTIYSNIYDDLILQLELGQNVVCMITSNNIATQLYQQFKEQYKCLLYTGDDNKYDDNDQLHYKTKLEDMQNINDKWSQCQLLIYTSTITAGVDFNQQHFNTFIHCYVNNTCDPIQFVQGIQRVRSFKNDNHIIYLQQQASQTFQQSPYQIIQQDDQQYILYDSSVQIKTWIRSKQQCLAYNQESFICKQLQRLGYQLSYLNVEKSHTVELQDQDYKWDLQISEYDYEIYKKIQYNKEILLTLDIDESYYYIAKKISLLLYVGIPNDDLCNVKYTDVGYMKAINKNKEALHRYKNVKYIGETLDIIYKYIANDKQRKNNNVTTINDKRVDYTTIKDNIQGITFGNQYLAQLQELLQTQQQLSHVAIKNANIIDTSNKRWCTMINKALSYVGYKLNLIQRQQIKGIKYSFYTLIQLNDYIN